MCVCACVWRLENAVWRRFSVVVLHLLCNLTGHWLFHFCQLVQVHFNCNFLHHFLSWGGRVRMLQKRLLSSLEPVSRCTKENQLVFLLLQPSIDCYWSNGANKYMCSTPFGHVTVLIIFPNIFRRVCTHTHRHTYKHTDEVAQTCVWLLVVDFPIFQSCPFTLYQFIRSAFVCMHHYACVCIQFVLFCATHVVINTLKTFTDPRQ